MTGSPEETWNNLPVLPVTAVLPELEKSLAHGCAVLAAPPGSGKTTLVPLHLLQAPWLAGKRMLLLEPRRLAARAAASYMSRLLGEKTGQTVGYRVHLDHLVSKQTRIEVVTEGMLTRQLQSDSGLEGIGLVIFDEFHERGLQADLGLTLCLDLRQLRPDLRILVMSATLDTEEISAFLDHAPVILAEGREYPVAVRYQSRESRLGIAQTAATGIRKAFREEQGDILAFLPGAGEITATARLLEGKLEQGILLPLHSRLPSDRQDLIFRQAPKGSRRVILATSIAETSLTIEGISTVVDSGWSRLQAFDPATGLDCLVTVRVSRAAMRQRQGRAGRLGPGVCYRLWTEAMEHSFADFHPPEIRQADLSTLVLQLALWGVGNPDQLRWLDPPPAGAWQVAVELLRMLGALDEGGMLTGQGRSLAALPIHPRLGHMILAGKQLGLGSLACDLAALLHERVPALAGHDADISQRLHLLRQNAGSHRPAPAVQEISRQSSMLARLCGISRQENDDSKIGLLLSLAWPERIAALRPGVRNRYLLASGRGAVLPEDDPLCAEPFLVIPRLQATQCEARIHLAARLPLNDLMEQHQGRITRQEEVFWDNRSMATVARQVSRLGKIILQEGPLAQADPRLLQEALFEGIQTLGLSCLGWNPVSRTLRQRILLLRESLGQGWPDVSDKALLDDLAWLVPALSGSTRIMRLDGIDPGPLLLDLLSWEQRRDLEQLAPSHVQVPSGSRIRLSYQEDGSVILPVRLQEMFGCAETPRICQGRVALTVHLLSPAGRPLQVTGDLLSFWRTGYVQVRKEMAGRYPRHHWPVDPMQASATAGTKKRPDR